MTRASFRYHSRPGLPRVTRRLKRASMANDADHRPALPHLRISNSKIPRAVRARCPAVELTRTSSTSVQMRRELSAEERRVVEARHPAARAMKRCKLDVGLLTPTLRRHVSLPGRAKSTDIACVPFVPRCDRADRAQCPAQSGKPLARKQPEAIRAAARPDDRPAVFSFEDAAQLFAHESPRQLNTVALQAGGRKALGRGGPGTWDWRCPEDDRLPGGELRQARARSHRRGTDDVCAGQFRKHCRHKIFNADWVIDGERQPKSPARDDPQYASSAIAKACFSACTATTRLSSAGDRQALVRLRRLASVRIQRRSRSISWMKVETHNHLTAISPFPGAATGSGGEIRDEGATGRGGVSAAGWRDSRCRTCASRFRGSPGSRTTVVRRASLRRSTSCLKADRRGGARQPGSAARNILGYFRTFETQTQSVARATLRGYHSPS